MGPRLFHALLQRASAAPESDAELLRRFAATRDEPAFAELVRRYGGLVWGQCRNLLPNEADAEDAFQATFLALAQRPGAVRAAVGPYLHGVAYRVCLNARRLAGRRKRREVASATSEAERPVADSAWDAALAAVHAELHRLPDPQRVAFVLCVLEGRGLTDAAAHLGVKLGTLSARLSRAKQTLMGRLAEKGVLAGMAAVATLSGTTAVTAALVEKAVQSAVGATVVPDVVLSLTHGVTTMATKFKLLAAAVLLACGLGLGVGSGWVATAQDKPKVPEGPNGAYLLPQAEAKYHDLRLRLLQAQAELEQAQKAASADKPVAAKKADVLVPEFKYIPLTGDGVMHPKDFEKVVAENETDGYTFVGSVPLAGRKYLNKIAEEAFPTLVFRKKPEQPKPVAPAPGAAGAKQEKLYAVNFDKVPWPKVAEWLAKETDLRLAGEVAPEGTCTIKFDRKVAIGELMDVFNETLAQQKLIVVRGEQTFRFWPTDKPLPQLYVAPVRMEDLHKYGKSEFVKVVFPLKGNIDKDAAKMAKKLLSQFGEMTLTGTNQLVVVDRAGEVRAIRAAIAKQLGGAARPVGEAAKPVQAKATVELGPQAERLAQAVVALAEKKFDGRQDALRLVVSGSVLNIQGDADVVKWVTDLIDGLKK